MNTLQEIPVVVLSKDPGRNAYLQTALKRRGFACYGFYDVTDAIQEEKKTALNPKIYLLDACDVCPALQEVIRAFHKEDCYIDCIALLKPGDPVSLHEIKKYGIYTALVFDERIADVLPGTLQTFIRYIRAESDRTALEALQDIKHTEEPSAVTADPDELSRHNFFVRFMIEEVVARFQSQADEKSLSLNLLVADDVPSLIYADKLKIQQVLANLLSNAVKFTNKGFIDVKVSVNTRKDAAPQLFFSVQDTGIGIKKQDISLIFGEEQPMAHLAHENSRKGLHHVKSLVSTMGGEFGLTSTYRKGSHAFFTIPIEEIVPGELTEQGELTYRRPKQLRILLAEDDAISQMYLAGFLRSHGHRVDTAYNGLTAVDLYDVNKYDLIIMDGQMPRMDGFEASKRIRQIEAGNHHTPILAISGYTIPGDEKKFFAAGMDEYLPKPINENELLKAIAQLTE
ncbi:MAG: response regulator [Bacteroidales bacterium]|nr:response regulator [Bacteroidales bacterium]